MEPEVLKSFLTDKYIIGDNIYLYGRFLGENSFVLYDILKSGNLQYAKIDCCECLNTKDLGISLRRAFKDLGINLSDKTEKNLFVGSIERIKSACKRLKKLPTFKRCLIFEEFEKLSKNIPLINVRSLFKLNELLGTNFIILFTSVIPWECLGEISSYADPICLHFSYPDEDELVKYVQNSLMHLNDCLGEDFLRTFSENIVKINHSSHGSIRRLSASALTILSENLDLSKKSDQSELLSRKFMQKLFKKNVLNMTPSEGATNCEKSNLPGLCNGMKYLCIASYLASHTSDKADLKFYSKAKSRKRERKSCPSDYYSDNTRYFPLERLCAIFRCLSDQDTFSISHIQRMVSTANSLGLLSIRSQKDDYSSSLVLPHFKCNISQQIAEKIALDLNINISQYTCQVN